MGYSENILEEILSRIDIVELISSYIPLKRAGRNFKALCPFHQEKTPSFMVSPQKQIYHCFGCQSGGNAFNFLMRYEHIEFKEAVEILAKKAGVVLEEKKPSSQESYLSYYKINETVADFYHNLLNSSCGKTALNYLKNRKIKEQTIKLLKIGFAPDQTDALIQNLRQKNYSVAILEKLGLVLLKEGGGYSDRFRNRVILPIFDVKMRILGFGGRILESSSKATLAKYINSPQTPIYTKGNHLYGLNFAKDNIIKNDTVIVVEGYFDFITPFQEGLNNIVASLGTALTIEQARAIKRYTHNVVMIYDADNAGQLATLRSLDIFLEQDMEVKIASLPSGFDPDLYVRTYGIESFKNLANSAQNLFDYKLKILRSMHDEHTVEGKSRIAYELLTTIKKIPHPVTQANYIKKLSEELDIKEDALFLEFKKINNPASIRINPVVTTKPKSDIHPTEKMLIQLMLEEEEIIKKLKDIISPQDFVSEKTAKIVSLLFEWVNQGKKIMVNNLLNYFPQEDILPFVCELSFSPNLDETQKETMLNDCIQRLKERKIKVLRENLQKEIEIAQNKGDKQRLNSLMQEFCQLTDFLKKR